MNNASKPYTDVRVRRAITHAINKAEVLKGAMFGYGQDPRLQRGSAQPVLRRRVQARCRTTRPRPRSSWPRPAIRTASTPCSRWRRSTTTRCARPRSSPSQLAKVGVNVQDRADRVGAVALPGLLPAPCTDPDYDLTIIGHAESWDIAQLRQPQVLLPLRQRQVPGAVQGVRGHARRQGAPRALREDAAHAGRGRAGGVALHAPAAGRGQEGACTGFWKDLPVPAADLSEVGWTPAK